MKNVPLSIEDELSALLTGKDVAPHYVGVSENLTEVQKFAKPVDRFLHAFKNVQEQCARDSLELAQWFEDKAAELRNHAATINHQATQIPDDVRRAVEYETEVRSLLIRLGVAR